MSTCLEDLIYSVEGEEQLKKIMDSENKYLEKYLEEARNTNIDDDSWQYEEIPIKLENGNLPFIFEFDKKFSYKNIKFKLSNIPQLIDKIMNMMCTLLHDNMYVMRFQISDILAINSILSGNTDIIFDKLDENRVAHIISLVKEDHFGQLFISDTHPERTESIVKKVHQSYKIFELS